MRNYSFVSTSEMSALLPMLKAEWLCFKLNRTPLWQIRKRNRMLKRLFGSMDGAPLNVQIPIHCAWGKNIHVGKNFYSSYNFNVIDHVEVSIGDNCYIAPNVTISTEYHPMYPEDRRVKYIQKSFEPNNRTAIEINKPIHIGNDVYIASNSVISAGVNIGDGCVIGAGSIVTRDIPPYNFAYGAPCRAVRQITEEDRVTNEMKEAYEYSDFR